MIDTHETCVLCEDNMEYVELRAIFFQIRGYLKAWNADEDIGITVKKHVKDLLEIGEQIIKDNL